MKMAESGCRWMKMDASGWMWIVVDYLWMKVDERGLKWINLLKVDSGKLSEKTWRQTRHQPGAWPPRSWWIWRGSSLTFWQGWSQVLGKWVACLKKSTFSYFQLNLKWSYKKDRCKLFWKKCFFSRSWMFFETVRPSACTTGGFDEKLIQILDIHNGHKAVGNIRISQWKWDSIIPMSIIQGIFFRWASTQKVKVWKT